MVKEEILHGLVYDHACNFCQCQPWFHLEVFNWREATTQKCYALNTITCMLHIVLCQRIVCISYWNVSHTFAIKFACNVFLTRYRWLM